MRKLEPALNIERHIIHRIAGCEIGDNQISVSATNPVLRALQPKAQISPARPHDRKFRWLKTSPAGDFQGPAFHKELPHAVFGRIRQALVCRHLDSLPELVRQIDSSLDVKLQLVA